jgi:protein-S-isoprenylcysteine O-methyltransferase Ste14
MKATPLEFRLRFLIICVLFTLGFWAPWNLKLHLDSVRTWQAIASQFYQLHWLSFVAATDVVLILGILFALTAACLRTWGSAYLGASVVQGSSMHGDRMVAAGPYRHLRNPLYLGLFFLTLALALLMPPSGAVFAVVLINLFLLRLIGAEEAYLATQLGQPYLSYKAAVPSLLPSIRPRVAPSSTSAAWPMAFLSEIAMWGVAVSFGALGWSYNAQLILQGVLVSLGLSIVVRGLLPKKKGL